MSSRKYQPPYQLLGRFLKTRRQQLQETLGEASGAVEIDVTVLDKIERGEELPSEDVLLLLISHFDIADEEAVELWEMAGYEYPECGHLHHYQTRPEPAQPKNTMVMLAFDNRILYSNNAEIIADDAGVVINFGQTLDSNQPAAPVSRIGMSYDQAQKLLDTMQRALLRRTYGTGNRLLGSGPDAK